MNSTLRLILSGIAITCGAACSGSFHLDHPLPDPAAELASIAPSTVNGVEGNTECRIFGIDGDPVVHIGAYCASKYVNLGEIVVGKFNTANDAKTFVKHHQTSINRGASTMVEGLDVDWYKYSLENDGTSILWRKENWVFKVEANTPSNHNALVQSFNHISAKE